MRHGHNLSVANTRATTHGSWYKMVAKKPFGGYTVCFAKVKDMTLGEVFGTAPITPSQGAAQVLVLKKVVGMMF